jgi:hypothetical protein
VTQVVPIDVFSRCVGLDGRTERHPPSRCPRSTFPASPPPSTSSAGLPHRRRCLCGVYRRANESLQRPVPPPLLRPFGNGPKHKAPRHCEARPDIYSAPSVAVISSASIYVECAYIFPTRPTRPLPCGSCFCVLSSHLFPPPISLFPFPHFFASPVSCCLSAAFFTYVFSDQITV